MNYSTETIRNQILTHLAQKQRTKFIDPVSIAIALAGKDEKQWRLLMKPIRQQAIEMAIAGELDIIRKSKVIDPSDFKGLYKIAPKADA